MHRNVDGAPSTISPSLESPSIAHALNLSSHPSQSSSQHAQFIHPSSTFQHSQPTDVYTASPTPNLGSQHESPTQDMNTDEQIVKRKRGRPKGSKTKNRRIDGVLVPIREIQGSSPATADTLAHTTPRQSTSNPNQADEFPTSSLTNVEDQAGLRMNTISRDHRSSGDFSASAGVVNRRTDAVDINGGTSSSLEINFADTTSSKSNDRLGTANMVESLLPGDTAGDVLNSAEQEAGQGSALNISESAQIQERVSDFYQFQYRAMKICSDFYEAAEDLVRATSPTVLAQSFHSGSRADPMALIHNTKEFCEAFLATPIALNDPPEMPNELFPQFTMPAPTVHPSSSEPPASSNPASQYSNVTNVFPAPSPHLSLTSIPHSFNGVENATNHRESIASQFQPEGDQSQELLHGPLIPTQAGLSNAIQDPRQPQENRIFNQHELTPSLGTEDLAQTGSPSLSVPYSPHPAPQPIQSPSRSEVQLKKNDRRQSSTFVTDVKSLDNPAPILSINTDGKNINGSELVGKHVNQVNPSSTHGAWSKVDEDRLKSLAEQSRKRTTDGSVEWDWTVDQFGDSRTRHQILIKATSLGLKPTSTHPSRLRKKLSSSTPNLQAAMAASEGHPQPQLHPSSSRHTHSSSHHQPYPSTSLTAVASPRRVSSHRHIRSISQNQSESNPMESSVSSPIPAPSTLNNQNGGQQRNGMTSMVSPVGSQYPANVTEVVSSNDIVSPRLAEAQRYEGDPRPSGFRVPSSPSTSHISRHHSSTSGSRERGHRERLLSSSSHQQGYMHGNTGARTQDPRWTHAPQAHQNAPSRPTQATYAIPSGSGSPLSRQLTHESQAPVPSTSTLPQQNPNSPYGSTPQIFHPRSSSQGQLHQHRTLSYQSQVQSVQPNQPGMPVLRHSVSFGSTIPQHSQTDPSRSSRIHNVAQPSSFPQSSTYPSQQPSISDSASQAEQHGSAMRSRGSNLDGGLGEPQGAQLQHAQTQVHSATRPGYYHR
ncbi:hypothetical protein FRC02_008737 [Tulasnella sp. 418]|nr:hypothetical protein FRC02_008737 [Tulasnella sp. 418]